MTLIKQGYFFFSENTEAEESVRDKKGSSTPEKRNTSYSSNIQPRRISSFAALHNSLRIDKLNTYMLAHVTQIIFPCFNKRFKCVENSHFSTTDYFSVKLSPTAKLIQYYLLEKGSHISHRGQPYRVCKLVYYGSQAVEHSEFKHSP